MASKDAARGMELPGLKRPQSSIQDVEQLESTLLFKPLGSGREVGRSCHLVTINGKKVMLDCGIHPGYRGIGAMPFFDEIDDISTIDICLITHFHLDHAASLPYLITKTAFKGRVFMTYATKAVTKLMLADYVRVSNGGASREGDLYDQKCVDQCMKKVETIGFHQERTVSGVKFTAYHAGHVLGAAMFALEIGGVKILYTGDYSRDIDRHLIPAEIPPFKPDVLIIESTSGLKDHGDAASREKLLTTTIEDVVRKGGHVLLPMFSQGRAQEIMLILEAHWEANPDLQDVPIIMMSRMASKSLTIFRTYTSQMNDSIRHSDRPFQFRHITLLSRVDEVPDDSACVVMASPGMLQTGGSRQLFERWCDEPKNAVVLCGYAVQGTLAKTLATGSQDHITSLDGRRLALRCQTKVISFMAHASFRDTDRFIEELSPSNVVLVHGDPKEMLRLQKELQKKYKRKIKAGTFKVFSPDNGEEVEFTFKHKKAARLLGRAAKRLRADVDKGNAMRMAAAPVLGVDALLVSKDNQLQLMDPTDVSRFTELSTTAVTQRLHVPFQCNFEALSGALSQMFHGVHVVPLSSEKEKHTDESEGSSPACDGESLSSSSSSSSLERLIRVEDAVEVAHCPKQYSIRLAWLSSPFNDMLADSIVALAMELQLSAAAAMRPSAATVESEVTVESRDIVKVEPGSVSDGAPVVKSPLGQKGLWRKGMKKILLGQFEATSVSFQEQEQRFCVALDSTCRIDVSVPDDVRGVPEITIVGASISNPLYRDYVDQIGHKLERLRTVLVPVQIAKTTSAK